MLYSRNEGEDCLKDDDCMNGLVCADYQLAMKTFKRVCAKEAKCGYTVPATEIPARAAEGGTFYVICGATKLGVGVLAFFVASYF